jgi:hypothetical protein
MSKPIALSNTQLDTIFRLAGPFRRLTVRRICARWPRRSMAARKSGTVLWRGSAPRCSAVYGIRRSSTTAGPERALISPPRPRLRIERVLRRGSSTSTTAPCASNVAGDLVIPKMLVWALRGESGHCHRRTDGHGTPHRAVRVLLWLPVWGWIACFRIARCQKCRSIGVVAPVEPVVDPHLQHLNVAVALSESVASEHKQAPLGSPLAFSPHDRRSLLSPVSVWHSFFRGN